MRIFIINVVLFVTFCLLQKSLFLGKDGIYEAQMLIEKINNEQFKNSTITKQNNILAAYVQDLKTGTTIFEENIRANFFMLKENESLFLLQSQQ